MQLNASSLHGIFQPSTQTAAMDPRRRSSALPHFRAFAFSFHEICKSILEQALFLYGIENNNDKLKIKVLLERITNKIINCSK